MAVPTLQPPRLLPELTPLRDPVLVDDTVLAGVDISGEVAGPSEVAYVELSGSRLANVRLTGRRFDHLRLVDVLIEDSDLSGVILTQAHFTRVELRRCRLSGLVASTLKARHVRITGCKADGAMFRMTTWEFAELRDVDLRESDFHASTLTGMRLLGCDLTGADLSKATMAGAALHGSTVEHIRGADSLRGAVIASDQVLSVALHVFAALGIVVDDDYLMD